MKTIVLTGGGTAGHVTPHIALIDELEKEYKLAYIGSHEGIEKELIKKENIPYYSIATGKLRRYLDFENIKDAFRVLKGIWDAFRVLGKIKPDLVFSKGGFVAVPVVLAAFLRRIPVVIHESDITPGLTTKISVPIAKKVCVTFPETMKHLPSEKTILTGTPIREDLLLGDRKKGFQLCAFTEDLPVLMIMGGSTGASFLNNLVLENIDTILDKFQVVHVCGEGNDPHIHKTGYKAFEYVHEELADLLAITDISLSRAGANAIWEWLALDIPSILVPLPLSVSRGDQILNAESFEKQGFSYVLDQEEITNDIFLETLDTVYKDRDKYHQAMNTSKNGTGNEKVIEVLQSFL